MAESRSGLARFGEEWLAALPRCFGQFCAVRALRFPKNPLAESDPCYEAALRELKALEPDFVVVYADQGVCLRIVKGMKESGFSANAVAAGNS